PSAACLAHRITRVRWWTSPPAAPGRWPRSATCHHGRPTMSDFLPLFARRFAALDAGSLDRLGQLYTEDIRFQDPLHRVEGLAALRDYFAALYANVQDLQFDFHGFEQSAAGAGYLRWTMRYRHPRLRGGAPKPWKSNCR